MTTASGARDIPFTRPYVWQALAQLPPYCSVCDVSYLLRDAAEQKIRKGTSFTCVQGQFSGPMPPVDAVEGEIVEWDDGRCFATQLERRSETWRVRTEFLDLERGSTRVTITVRHEPEQGSRLLQALQRGRVQRLVQQTVDSELAKLPDHVRAAAAHQRTPVESVQEQNGWVLHLRGEVDAQVVHRLQLQRRFEVRTVIAIDVSELTYIDAIALPPLVRWARNASQQGRRPVVRGASAAFDETAAVMGVRSSFLRES